jgi:hypothetical protein
MAPNFIWIETIDLDDASQANGVLVDIDRLTSVTPLDDLTAYIQLGDTTHLHVNNDSLHKVLEIIGKDYAEDRELPPSVEQPVSGAV